MNRIYVLLVVGVSSLALASAAQAADLVIEEPVVGVVDVASGSWDGAYIGVFGGGLWGDYEDNGPIGGSEDASGWLLGLTAGADFTVTEGVVAGIVADVAWADAGFDYSDGGGDYSFNVDWMASVRGKLGFDAGAFLPYLTAGLAVAGTSYEYDGIGTFDETATHVGWTVGAGVEFAVTEDVSVDLLYRYSDFGTETYAESIAPYDASLTAHAVTVGLNWRF